MPRAIVHFLGVFALAGTGAAVAGPQQSHACAAVLEADARLACYDKAFPPSAGAQSETVDLEVRRKQAVENYGFSERQLFERNPEQGKVDPDHIRATVKGVAERSRGERVVTLENGQVWMLTEGTSRGRLRSGDQVTIRNAALGTYMLVTPSGIALRAKRLH